MTTETYIINELNKYIKKNNIPDINIILQKPKDEKFGDYAANVAMQLARHLHKKPLDIAQDIIDSITIDTRYISKVEIAGQGFINFYSSNDYLFQQLDLLINKGEKFGYTESAKGKKAQIEFVSANPTGPLTIGHGRQAVLGDTLARLLEMIGYDVTREYYFNNAGRQMRILGDSIRFRYMELIGKELEFPDDHYQGKYIIDIARSILEEHGKDVNIDDTPFFTKAGEENIFEDIKKTVKRLGFSFDVFYNEKSLYETGKIDNVVKELGKLGLTKKEEGALWFLTTKLGFEQNRVLIKSSGEPTYRLPDMAYHIEKVKRGFDLIIDIFGADHIATFPDVLAAVKSLGYDTEKIKVLIHQFVTLTEKGEKVKMSTRKANFVTLDELMDEVGVDVTRFFFLMRHMNAHLNFDLALAKTQSDENPVFYIQYAHARICSIIELGKERGIVSDDNADLSILSAAEEINLIKHLIDFPKLVEAAALNFEPHRLTNYLFETASLFHKFYTVCRVLSDDKALSQARLSLIKAVRVILANGLKILGISSPDHM